MKINKEKLVQLLVKKTGMETGEVADQLDQLIQRIVEAARKGKALEIREFGLFYFDADGDLKFEPSTEFSTEVNFKYAGMDPIELNPTRKTAVSVPAGAGEPDEDPFSGLESDPDTNPSEQTEPDSRPEDDPFEELETDEQTEADPFGVLNTEEETQHARKAPREAEVTSDKPQNNTDEPGEEVEERDNDPFSGLLQDASDKLTREETDAGDTEIDDIFNIPERTAQPAKRPPKKPVKTDSKSNPVTIVIMLLFTFVLLAAGYIAYIEFYQTSAPQETVVDFSGAGDSPNQAENPIPVEDTPGVMADVELEEDSEVSENEGDLQTESTPYGLMGSVNEAGNDGFSIVVYSYNREFQARNTAADLSGEGYRVLVTSRTIQGNIVWRVSLGQFPTIAEALEQAAELPQPFNTEHFIQRIQNN